MASERVHHLKTFLLDARYSATLVRDEESERDNGDPRTVALVITHIEEALLRLGLLIDPRPLKDD